ncbi:MAG: arginine--tRNA ligase [Mycoplasmataceae bacterium]|nr:arginine--tRNA ligase [Mycoplasmataceae bacterium]
MVKPFELADFLADEIGKYSKFSKVERVMPGFINIYFSKDFFKEIISEINDSKNYGKINKNYKPKTINFEFISANPTGELHVGHIRQGVIGDVSCRILEYLGNDVTRGYYLNDLGVQIENLAKSVYYYYLIENKIKPTEEIADYNTPEIKEFAKELFKRHGNKFCNEKISKEKAIIRFKDLSLNHFNELIKLRVKQLGIKEFDEWYSEKEIYSGDTAKNVLKSFADNKFSYKQDGALWLKTIDFGDEKDRVLIKKDGNQTYFLPDITNHYLKFASDKKYDLVIDLFGADHHGYEKRMFSAINKMGFDESKFRIDFIQMVMITDDGKVVKMSKRAGTSVRAVDMIQQLGKDLIRFYITDRSREQHLELDMKSIESESFDNPYYYMQYSSARANKLLNDANKISSKVSLDDVYDSEFSRKLLINMYTINNVLISASEKNEPYILNNYLREISSDFHKFYSNYKVIEDGKVYDERVKIVSAYLKIFNLSTNLLGITPMKKM